jgi:beta-phosphoglucomutase
MDGVLIDSEEYICRAAIEMYRQMGFNMVPDDFKPFTGMGENRYIGGVAEKYNIKLDIKEAKSRTYQIYEEITRGMIKPLPGSTEFISRCREAGLRIAVATSADKVKLDINMRGLGFSNKDFDAMVNGLEVERKKPFPDIYQKAAEKIGLDPHVCLVVEDAVSGVRAAKAAGCKCLALTTSFGPAELNEADWICRSLSEAPEEVIKW